MKIHETCLGLLYCNLYSYTMWNAFLKCLVAAMTWENVDRSSTMNLQRNRMASRNDAVSSPSVYLNTHQAARVPDISEETAQRI